MVSSDRSPPIDPNPVPVIVLRRGPLTLRALAALENDARHELYTTDELSQDWLAFANRVAAVVVATEGEPLSALGYAVTAGVTAPIIVAMSTRYGMDCADLIAAGASACVSMPLTRRDVDGLAPLLATYSGPARIDGSLRLLLDPISRVVRYRAKVAHLSLREFALLHCLSSRYGRPVPAEDMMNYVWGDTGATDRSRRILDVYIFQLRKKLETLGVKGAISTVRGFGYALGAPAPSTKAN